MLNNLAESLELTKAEVAGHKKMHEAYQHIQHEVHQLRGAVHQVVQGAEQANPFVWTKQQGDEIPCVNPISIRARV